MSSLKGKTQTPEHIEKRTAQLRGRKRTEEQKQRMREAHANQGPMSAETKAKVSAKLKGRKHSLERRQKVSAALKGKPKSESHRQNMHRFGTGADNPNSGGMTDEHRQRISAALMGHVYPPQSEEQRRKSGAAISKAWLEGRHSGSRGRGRVGVRADLGKFFRSRWEANYARYLTAIGVAWQHEPCRLATPYGSYGPDFYLPQFGVYVEVKGWDYTSIQPVKREWLMEMQGLPLIMVWGGVYRKLAARYDWLPEWE